MRKRKKNKRFKSEIIDDSRKLYFFGKPHLKMVIAAVICMALYTSLTGFQLALVKPLIDNLIKGETSNFTENFEDEIPDVSIASLGGISFEDELPDKPISKLKTFENFKLKTKSFFEHISLVSSIKSSIKKCKNSFTSIGIIALILAPLIFISFYCQRYFANRIIWGITRDIRNKVCEHLLPQSLTFFENKKSGELISRITNDIAATQGAVNILFSHVLLQPMKLACGLGLSFYFNWKLTLFSLMCLPLIVIPVIIFGKKVKKHSKSSLRYLADLTDMMREMFSGIRIVKAYSMEKEEINEIRAINQSFFDKRMKSSMARSTSNGITEFIYGIGLGVIIICGGFIISSKKISPGELGAFITILSFMVCRAIKQLSKSYNTLQDSLAGANRVFELLEYENTTQDVENAEELTGIEKGITFSNVTFGYNEKHIIRNINIDIKKGNIIGIVGQSGSGKSTILNLILKFYTTEMGKIEIDGKDIRQLKHKSLLDNIALVTQQTFLFNRSIKENIMYGSNHSNQQEIVNAAKSANIHKYVESLPDGYETIVGEMGVKLSGGQRQRIAIARAFLKNAPILILDEATSSLDSKAEQSVQEALNILMKNKTTLLVAHRLTTIKDCDQILVLKDGIIIEKGTHNELINKNGEYNMLYKMQSQE